MKIGDLVTIDAAVGGIPGVDLSGAHFKQHVPEYGVGIILEVLNRGYARKNASALVFWSSLNKTSFHAEPQLRILNENR